MKEDPQAPDEVKVAPFTGAWIEIRRPSGPGHRFRRVAPFTGAWIEIAEQAAALAYSDGRTLHGCVD